jgi:hypothetical protein
VRDYAAVWQQRAAALAQHLRQHGWQLPEPQACEWSDATCQLRTALGDHLRCG